jgi:putative lipoic acid-binding regulatory protein
MSDQKETLFEFPCPFPVKVFGDNHDDFEIAVIEIISRHCGDIAEGALSTKESKGGKYLSMTITIEAQSKDQLDNIYRELSSHTLVKMAL